MAGTDGFSFDAREFLELPEFSLQDELLALPSVTHTVDSDVPDPVAHVRIADSALPIDQIFDYQIPIRFADVRVGCRVQVQLGSRKVDAFIVARDAHTAVGRKLRPILRVISYVPVLTPTTLKLCEDVAAQSCAPVADCLRLAVPHRHATIEKEFFSCDYDAPVHHAVDIDNSVFADYNGGLEFLENLQAKRAHHAVMHVLPTHTYIDAIVPAISAALNAHTSVIVLAPTPQMSYFIRDVIKNKLPHYRVASLTSHDDPSERYKNFLSVLTSRVQILVGTRSAAWAPMNNLGLGIIIDDLHSAYREQRSPYVHARDVLWRNCQLSQAALLNVSHWPSAASLSMIDSGDAIFIDGNNCIKRSSIPQVLSTQDFLRNADAQGRMPDSVFSVVRKGLEHGSVLISVPHAGYLNVLTCMQCGMLARCDLCAGQLDIPSPSHAPRCTRCSRMYPNYLCQHCGGRTLRALRIGSYRTAEEIGRAFPGVTINVFAPDDAYYRVDDKPKIVVATAGSEDRIQGEFAASVLLDAHYLLRSVRSEAELYFFRGVSKIVSVTQSREHNGTCLIVGNLDRLLIQSITHWDSREWWNHGRDDRTILGMPPVKKWVLASGNSNDLLMFLSAIRTLVIDSTNKCKEKFHSRLHQQDSVPHAINDGDSIRMRQVLSDADTHTLCRSSIDKRETESHDHTPVYVDETSPTDNSFETILLGGVHDLIPGMSILGPREDPQGQSEVFLRYDPMYSQFFDDIIKTARSMVAIAHGGTRIKIVVNPVL